MQVFFKKSACLQDRTSPYRGLYNIYEIKTTYISSYHMAEIPAESHHSFALFFSEETGFDGIILHRYSSIVRDRIIF